MQRMTGRKWSILLLLLAPGARAQGPQVSVNAPADVDPGSTVEVRVDVSNLANLGGVVFDVSYDGARLSLEGVSVEGTLAEQGLFASNPETFPSASGRLRFGFVRADGVSGSGTVVKLAFRLLPGAGGENPLPLENLSGVDTALGDVALAPADGLLTVLLAVVDVKTGLQILSIPVQLTRPSPPDVFGVPADEWANRLAVYDPTLNEGQGGYLIFGRDPGDYDFRPGRAAWVKAETDRRLRVREGQLPDPMQAMAVSLRQGWNLFGPPWSEPLPWSLTDFQVRKSGQTKTLAEAQAAGWIEDYAWGWQQDANDPNTGRYALVYDSSVIPGIAGTLEPGKGYWVKAKVDCELLLPPPAARGRGTGDFGTLGTLGTSRGWSVRLQAQAAEVVGNGRRAVPLSGEAVIGETSQGKAIAAGRPPQPPTSGSPVQVWLVRDGQPLALDVRPGNATRQVWEMVVQAEGEGRKRLMANDGGLMANGGWSTVNHQPSTINHQPSVILTWPDLRGVPGDVSLTLVDTATGTRQYMRTTTHYGYRPTDVGAGVSASPSLRHFQIIAERGKSGSLQISTLQAEPTRGPGMRLTFTLTKAAQTTVVVRSLAGRSLGSVEVLRSRAAGVNVATWEGRDPQGRPLPPGVYLVEVQAVDEEGQQVQAVRTVRLH
jgi:hypothetical protein